MPGFTRFLSSKIENFEGQTPKRTPKRFRPQRDSGATYAVAFFHTHTPTTYRKEGQTRTTGIGGNDPFAAEMKNVGVIVYDYSTSSTIGRGYPENSPAKLYYYGQRSIESGKE